MPPTPLPLCVTDVERKNMAWRLLLGLDMKNAKSPMGYEMYDQVDVGRQVVIGGKNKYLINGKTSQQSQVANLFHSVQLNVNNPHFLIMQASLWGTAKYKEPVFTPYSGLSPYVR